MYVLLWYKEMGRQEAADRHCVVSFVPYSLCIFTPFLESKTVPKYLTYSILCGVGPFFLKPDFTFINI